MNKPDEQNASSTDQTAPGKAPPSFKPEPTFTKDNPSKDAPGKPTTGGTAKGDDDAMSRPAQPQKTS